MSIDNMRNIVRDGAKPAKTTDDIRKELEGGGPIDINLNSSNISQVKSSDAGSEDNEEYILDVNDIAMDNVGGTIPGISRKTVVNMTDAPGFLHSPVVITEDDKRSYLDAIVYNKRFVAPFSLYGDKVSGEFQSRTPKEDGIVRMHLMEKLQEKGISDSEYWQEMRCMLLAIQVRRVVAPENIQEFGDLEPGDKEEIFKRYEYWKNKDNPNPAFNMSMFDQLQEFERKYVAMIEKSGEENFW